MFLSLLYVVVCGIALPIGGLQMQYLWRNQLGDIYSLGLGSAACLGAAFATMSGVCSLTIGAFVCSLTMTLVAVLVSLKVSTQNLITFGILFGTFIGSLSTIVVTNAPDGELLRKYYLWGAASFDIQYVSRFDLFFSLVLFAVGIVAALGFADKLNHHFQGVIELSNRAKSLVLLMIMFLVTSAISICGPIGFISLEVPNLSRIMCKSIDIRKHYIISSLLATGLLAITYFVVRYANFGIYLPVSATMSLIALPLMVVIFKKQN